jgi:hypothetical protein
MMSLALRSKTITALLLTWVASLLFAGCATDQAEKMRQEKSISVGSDLSLSVLGGQYRSTDRPEIGYDLAVARIPHGLGYENITNPSKLFFRVLNDTLRDTKIEGFTADTGFSWYPFKTSALRTGLHLSYENAHIAFNALIREGVTSDELARVEYDRQTIYLGVPVGWHWIWENGITFGLDFGPRLRVSTNKSIKKDGGDTVDEADRDKYIDDAEKDRQILLGGLITYLGYSF